MSFGSSGIGAAAHLTTELFKQTTGVNMTHVPYKGTAPAVQDLMGGSIQILVDTPSALMPLVRGGKIRALGMFSAKRLPSVPEVPTLAEAGGPALEVSTWVMFLAPAGVPRDIVNRLSAETAKALASPELKAKFDSLGIEPVGNSPEQAARFLDEEIAKWAKVITGVFDCGQLHRRFSLGSHPACLGGAADAADGQGGQANSAQWRREDEASYLAGAKRRCPVASLLGSA